MTAELKLEMWAIEEIAPYDNNVKKHPPEQVKGLAKLIRETGWDQPIVVDRNGVIIKGHGRRLAAIELGLTKVPVIVRRDLTPEQVKAARIADNRVAMGDIDTAALRVELAEIDLEMLRGIFTDKELEFSTADLGEMNPGAFIDDLDSEVRRQEAETKNKAEELKESEVPLTRAMGFKSIAGKDEIYLNRFMAQLEQQTGMKGSAAFMSFVKGLVGEIAS
jgi:ParB-like chromosome segregation protein Spo0J